MHLIILSKQYKITKRAELSCPGAGTEGDVWVKISLSQASLRRGRDTRIQHGVIQVTSALKILSLREVETEDASLWHPPDTFSGSPSRAGTPPCKTVSSFHQKALTYVKVDFFILSQNIRIPDPNSSPPPSSHPDPGHLHQAWNLGGAHSVKHLWKASSQQRSIQGRVKDCLDVAVDIWGRRGRWIAVFVSF